MGVSTEVSLICKKSPLGSANMVAKKEKEKKKEKRKENKPSVRSHHKEGPLMDHHLVDRFYLSTV